MKPMEITLALGSYDDIFDDFDRQGYIERAISADLVNELGSRIKKTELKDRIAISFSMPKEKREKGTEEVISKRLGAHFANMSRYWEEKERETTNFAMFILALGLVFFIVGQRIIDEVAPFFDEYFIIPAWVFTFHGLDKLTIERPKATSRKQFYEAVNRAKIAFREQDAFSR